MGGIRKKIKRKLFEICPNYIADELFGFKYQYYNNISFSQEGEDLVLNRFFENNPTGFYVDVGAHHPIRFSNTYKFYKKGGWQGINIDAMPGSMAAFNKLRPKDINLELGISNIPQTLKYYIFNEPALNTFSEKEAKLHNEQNYFRIIDTIRIPMHTLTEILDSYLPENTKIDFLSIDVEGLDLSVLESNDWNKYRPTMVLVESLRESLDLISNNKIYLFLKGKGYSLVAKTYNTIFFKDDES